MKNFETNDGNTHHVERLELSDEPSVVVALAAAFRDNPMNRAVIGDHERTRLGANAHGLRTSLIASRRYSYRRVIRFGDQVAAALIAFDPGGYPSAPPPVGDQLRCFFGQGFRVMYRWGKLYRDLHAVHPKDPHCYLALIGVRPELQRAGLGRALMRDWLREVDTRVATGYLETDREDLVGYYRAAGFAVARRLSAFGTSIWCMARSAVERDVRADPFSCDLDAANAPDSRSIEEARRAQGGPMRSPVERKYVR